MAWNTFSTAGSSMTGRSASGSASHRPQASTTQARPGTANCRRQTKGWYVRALWASRSTATAGLACSASHMALSARSVSTHSTWSLVGGGGGDPGRHCDAQASSWRVTTGHWRMQALMATRCLAGTVSAEKEGRGRRKSSCGLRKKSSTSPLPGIHCVVAPGGDAWTRIWLCRETTIWRAGSPPPAGAELSVWLAWYRSASLASSCTARRCPDASEGRKCKSPLSFVREASTRSGYASASSAMVEVPWNASSSAFTRNRNRLPALCRE